MYLKGYRKEFWTHECLITYFSLQNLERDLPTFLVTNKIQSVVDRGKACKTGYGSPSEGVYVGLNEILKPILPTCSQKLVLIVECRSHILKTTDRI